MTFTPYPWQVEDAAVLAAHPRWILANEMRTGKTGAAILATACVPKGVADRIHVNCPAIVVEEWHRAIRDFDGLAGGRQWTVSSYDAWTRGAKKPSLVDVGVLINDECHYLKTPDAKRTAAIYGAASARTPYVWGLSGTPAPNHAGEYWTHARAFGRTDLTYWQFLEHFCVVAQTPFGQRIAGNRRETLPELRTLLAGMMSRRTQASVWAQTPQPFWSVRALEPEARDRAALADLDARIDRNRAGDLSQERHELGRIKVPYVLQHVVELLTYGAVPKILIGAWHRDVLEDLRRELGAFNPIAILGGTSETTRWDLIDRFQTAPTCRVALVQMKAGGVGINLSKAAHVVLAEPDWGRDVNEQFVQRPQHIARTVPLPVDLLTLAGTLDENILRANIRKRRMDTEISGADAPGAMAVPSLDPVQGVPDESPLFLDNL